MEGSNLFFCDTGDTITLYWDTQKATSSEVMYAVILDDKHIGSTDKTHFTIKQTIPDTDYQVKVMAGETVLGSASIHTT